MSADTAMGQFRNELAKMLATTSRTMLLDPAPPQRVVRQAEVLDRILELFPQVAEACRDERGREYAMKDLPRDVVDALSQARHQVTMILKANSTQG